MKKQSSHSLINIGLWSTVDTYWQHCVNWQTVLELGTQLAIIDIHRGDCMDVANLVPVDVWVDEWASWCESRYLVGETATRPTLNLDE